MNLRSWFAPTVFASNSALLVRPQPASDQDLEDPFIQAYVTHFTTIGKPWMYDICSVNEPRPYAHQLLLRQWEKWTLLALAVCPAGLINHV